MYTRLKNTFLFSIACILMLWTVSIVMMGLAVTITEIGEGKYFYAIGILIMTLVHTTVVGAYTQYLMETFDE